MNQYTSPPEKWSKAKHHARNQHNKLTSLTNEKANVEDPQSVESLCHSRCSAATTPSYELMAAHDIWETADVCLQTKCDAR